MGLSAMGRECEKEFETKMLVAVIFSKNLSNRYFINNTDNL